MKSVSYHNLYSGIVVVKSCPVDICRNVMLHSLSIAIAMGDNYDFMSRCQCFLAWQTAIKSGVSVFQNGWSC